MAETSTGFVAECFWVGISDDDLSALDQRVESRVAEMSQQGRQIRYHGSLLMREDEVVMCFFEGSSDDVRRAAELAGIPFDRIIETTRSRRVG